MIRTIIRRTAGAPEFAQGAAGMETTTTSAHFESRAGRKQRKWMKVTTIVL